LRLCIKKGNKRFAAVAIARKLIMAIGHALKGFLPEILDHAENLHGKLLGIARELGLAYAKKLGFKNCIALANEYADAVLLYGGAGAGGWF
jgi:hypothetical protein